MYDGPDSCWYLDIVSCLDDFFKYINVRLIFLYKYKVKLFNTILDTEIVPEPWTIDIIKPIFENKNNPMDPVDSNRGITRLFQSPGWSQIRRKRVPFLFAVYLNDLEDCFTK